MYTLPRDEKSSDPKGWIPGNTKFGTVLEVTTSYSQGKHGLAISVESVNKDNSPSWVRISHGLNTLVMHLSNNKKDDNSEQETSEMKFEEFSLKTNVFAFASRSKAKAKPRRRTSVCSSTRTLIMLIGGGKTRRATRTSTSFGESRRKRVSVSLLGKGHPAKFMAMDW